MDELHNEELRLRFSSPGTFLICERPLAAGARMLHLNVCSHCIFASKYMIALLWCQNADSVARASLSDIYHCCAAWYVGYLLRGTCVQSKSFKLPLFLGLVMTFVFPGVGMPLLEASADKKYGHLDEYRQCLLRSTWKKNDGCMIVGQSTMQQLKFSVQNRPI